MNLHSSTTCSSSLFLYDLVSVPEAGKQRFEPESESVVMQLFPRLDRCACESPRKPVCNDSAIIFTLLTQARVLALICSNLVCLSVLCSIRLQHFACARVLAFLFSHTVFLLLYCSDATPPSAPRFEPQFVTFASTDNAVVLYGAYLKPDASVYGPGPYKTVIRYAPRVCLNVTELSGGSQ